MIVVRVLIAILALLGILGYENGIDLAILSLGVLNLIHGLKFFQKKQRSEAVASLLVGVCVLLVVVCC